MSNLISNSEAIAAALIGGDIAKLSTAEKISYYNNVCSSLGLNPLTKPFAFIKLNGKETLYATRDCTDQIRKLHKVSIEIKARETINGVYVVTAAASLPDGRRDESTGAIALEHLKGEALANAYLKCETKAKRRVTLSICGLGMLDETETETIKDATPIPYPSTSEAKTVKLPVQSLDDLTAIESKELQQALAKDKESLGFAEAWNDFDAGPIEESAEYVVKIGRADGPLKGKKIKDIPTKELYGFLEWLRTKAPKDMLGKPNTKEFIAKAEDYLNDLKQREIESR